MGSGLPSSSSSLPSSVSRSELLVEGNDHAFRQLVHDMLAFGAVVQEIRNRLGELIGLSGAQYTILIAIARLSERVAHLGVNQLATHLHLSGAFVTIEVNALVRAGLVKKAINAEDRRRVVLSLNKKGQQILQDLGQVQQPVNDTLFGGLSKSEFEALRAIMAGLARQATQVFPIIDAAAKSGRLAQAPRHVSARRPLVPKRRRKVATAFR